jgi:hypothetical protein
LAWLLIHCGVPPPPLGGVLLRYSRDFDKQADLLGLQIMARAGSAQVAPPPT